MKKLFIALNTFIGILLSYINFSIFIPYISLALNYIRGGFVLRLFKSCGGNLQIGKTVRFLNHHNIVLGQNVAVGSNSIIASYHDGVINIDDNVNIGEFTHITCINSIHIGYGVLTGRFVTITDNSHGKFCKEGLAIEPWKRSLVSSGPISIGKNVWLGDKVTVLPNVTIGEGSIIGANSVVTKNIPPHCVAVGSPAKVIKTIEQGPLTI